VTFLTLDTAVAIARAVVDRGREAGLKPLTVALLDSGGHIKVLLRDDGASLLREKIAVAKAYGALGMGLPSRALAEMADQRPLFVQSLTVLANGNLVPVAGGVLIKAATGELIGAAGVTGDTSDNDEDCAVHGVKSVGLVAEAG
jgi:uncharacterized protein GlcG (DUF336 family)